MPIAMRTAHCGTPSSWASGATIHADATSESGSQMRTKMPPISMPPCTSAGLDAPE